MTKSNQLSNVKIKYNKYLPETEIEIDGKVVSNKSKLYKYKKESIQKWIHDIAQLLIDEINDDEFNMEFEGCLEDFEDLKEVLTIYKKINLSYIKIQQNMNEKQNKIEQLNEIFEYIKNGPFEELKTEEVRRHYERAISSEVEMAVIATMSSGKSTLINAMLHNDLMPSKNEACTARICKIKNVDERVNFKATSYNSQGKELEVHDNVTLEILEKLNDNKEISVTCIEGNIPNIQSDNMNLVLIDTPGPNNSQDSSHREKTFEVIKNNETKPMVIYVLNATQLGTDDDNKLLTVIRDAIKEKDKQSQERFIFVLNKIDAIDAEKESVESIIQNARKYLQRKGIENPKIYPISASLAKNIRKKQAGYKLTMDEECSIMMGCYKFKQIQDLHLLKYTPLNNDIKSKLNKDIEKFREENDELNEVLYHSGIPYIEAAINEYLNKYSLTYKIQQAIGAFKRIIEQKNIEAEIEKRLNVNFILSDEKISKVEKENDEINELRNKIRKLKELLKDKNAEELKNKIDSLDLENISKRAIYIYTKIESDLLNISKKIRNDYKEKISIEEVNNLISNLKTEIDTVEADLKTDLNNLIKEEVEDVSLKIINEYKEQIKGILDENNTDFTLLNDFIMASIPDDSEVINKIIYDNSFKERVEAGEEWIDDRKWYNPFSWLSGGYYKTIYEDKTFISIDKFIQEYIDPVHILMAENIKSALEYIKEKQIELKEKFKRDIELLDEKIKEAISNLESTEKLYDDKQLNIYKTESEIKMLKIQEDQLKYKEKWLKSLNEMLYKINA